ncbi:WD40 repeat-like protein [Lentinula edodes]|uniref:WD40 repeat-like protein n=1 Tax=Lentinula edodes TaxID=5353 RepID=A0A1Q3E5N7_LENED|nr:WD40 repeat-like protein [Lentinula edodes]
MDAAEDKFFKPLSVEGSNVVKLSSNGKFITLTRIKLKRKLNLQEKHGSQLDEDKATPQLWKLDASKNTSRLTIHQRYFPKVPTDFAGPSYFGGKNEELVLCVDKNLHIWDRESGTLLHRIRAYELGRDVTCIAWNHPHDPFMFATGSLHGSVQLWTRHEQQLLSPTLRSASPDDMRDSDIPLPQQEQEAGSGQRNDALR